MSHRGVVSWIEPVAGTDYVPKPGISISGAADGDAYVLTFVNTNSTEEAVGALQVRGTPLVAGDAAVITSEDTGSIAAFGAREYARPAPLFQSLGAAQEYADGIVNRQAVPRGWLVARWPAYADVAHARTLDLSRRITVERLGETRDYYIEGASIALRGFARMEYLLSPVPGATVPSAPLVTVAQVAGQGTWLAVAWVAPYNGESPITDYDVQYKESTSSTWITWAHTGTSRTATITGLEPAGVYYDVQVRAENSSGGGSMGRGRDEHPRSGYRSRLPRRR